MKTREWQETMNFEKIFEQGKEMFNRESILSERIKLKAKGSAIALKATKSNKQK